MCKVGRGDGGRGVHRMGLGRGKGRQVGGRGSKEDSRLCMGWTRGASGKMGECGGGMPGSEGVCRM